MWKDWTGGPASGPVQGAPRSSGGAMIGNWQPDVVYLLLLVLFEIIVVAVLSRTILR